MKTLGLSLSLSPSPPLNIRKKSSWVGAQDSIRKRADGSVPRGGFDSPNTPRFKMNWGDACSPKAIAPPSPASSLPNFSFNSPSSVVSPASKQQRSTRRPYSAHPATRRAVTSPPPTTKPRVRPMSAPAARSKPKEEEPPLRCTTPRIPIGATPVQPQSNACHILAHSPSALCGTKNWRPRPSSAMYIVPGSPTCQHRCFSKRHPGPKPMNNTNPNPNPNPNLDPRHLSPSP